MPCSNCGREKVAAKGLCQTCYYRVRRTGSLQRTNVINTGKCSHPGCEREAFAKNLCGYHYEKHRHPLMLLWRRLRSRHHGQFPDTWKKFDAFLKDIGERPSERHQLRRIDEAAPFSAENVKWFPPVMPQAKHGTASKEPTYAREWQLAKNYGISLADYAAMFAAQDGKCAICQNPETALDRKGRVRPLAVDHDHKTKAVRQLICNRCNHVLGLADDDPAVIAAAIAYLERHAVDTPPSSA